MASIAGRRPSPTMSILQGSDEDLPVCLPCERGGISVEAEGFCRTCNEHLCQVCYNSHLLPKPLANHVLLDKSSMPREVPLPEDMCTEHPHQPLEYFCGNHDTLNCRKCVHTHHRKCENVSDIQDICDDIEDTEEFKTMYKTLTDIENDVVQNKTKATTNLADIQAKVNETKAKIHNYRKYLDQQLDKMEEALCEQVDHIGATDNEAIINTSHECDLLTSWVRSVIYSLNVSRRVQQKMLLFITMKNAGRFIPGWQSTLEEINYHNKIQIYDFEPDTPLQDLIEASQSLGHVVMEGDEALVQLSEFVKAHDVGDEVDDHSVETAEHELSRGGSAVKQLDQSSSRGTKTHHKRVQNILPDITATKKDILIVKTELDVNDCSINGSVVINNTYLAVADSGNSAVKVVDLHCGTIVDRLSLNHPPFDITLIDNDSLAVTCPEGRYIQRIRVSQSGTLSLDQHIITEIPLDKPCYGIRGISGDRLVGTFPKSDKVSVMDMIGTSLQDFSVESHSRLSRPYHIAITEDGVTLIVSNSGNDTVTKLTMDGSYFFVYHDRMLQFPRGVAVGDRGEVYVCGGLSSNVQVISSDGRKIKVLLDQVDGVRNPESITYAENKLYVGSNNNNCVEVYTVQYQGR